MSKLLSLIRKAPKRASAVALMIAAAIILPATLLAWGPDRPTFTMEHPADHVTFNSITNNPDVGDERDFVRVRESGVGNYVDNMNLVVGKKYQVMVFYHNNAHPALNASGVGIAHDVKLRVQQGESLPAGATTDISAFISASNSTPGTVYDSSFVKNTSSDPVYMRYVDGSAKIASSNGAVNGASLPDTLFTTGTPLGYDALNGELKGCNQYEGYVTYEFVVDQPNLTVKKEVSVDDGKTWSQNASTTPGSTIRYRVTYTNTGTTQQDHVTIKDTLPTGTSYVAGSSYVAHAKTGGVYKASPDGVTTVGVDIGSFAPTANAFYTFKAKIADNDTLPACGDNKLHNVAKVIISTGSKESSADVTVKKECIPEVKYTCDALAITRISRTEFTFNTTYTVQNATFKKVTYIIRDDKGVEVERKDSASTTLNYTRTVVGKYTVEAVITVTVNGQDKTVSSDNCKKEFEVPKTPDYCVVPGKEYLPKDSKDCVELPHTGPTENIVAIIGLGALVASLVYYVASRRAVNQ